MFDIGFSELFLLGLIGLLVLGPERLPKVARTLGALVRKARTSWFALRRSIEAELAAADVSEPIKSVGKDLKEQGRRLGDDIQVKPEGPSPAKDRGASGNDSDRLGNGA